MQQLASALAALALAGPPVVAEPVPRPAPAFSAGMVRLHIELAGPRGETITVYRGTGAGWAFSGSNTVSVETADIVCSQPCDRDLSATAGTYFVSRPGDGPGLRSKAFSLAGRGPSATAYVRPGHRGAYVVGLALTVLGSSFAILGPILVGMGQTGSRSREATTLGIGFGAGGLAALLVGIPLLVRGRHRVRWSEAAQ